MDLIPIHALIVLIAPAILAVAIALGIAHFLVKRFGLPPAGGRFSTIDGLRGYLAFMVFLHHSSVWYSFVRTRLWRPPSSQIYVLFGRGSVDVFFMITAFLFWSKLIDSRTKPINWLRLYVSRVLRLFSLYAAVVLLMLLIVGIATRFQLRVPAGNLIGSIGKWLGFTVLGDPDINGFVDTRNIVAGVMWSLPYEWWFYLSLPMFGLLFRRVRPLSWIIFSILATTAGVYWGMKYSVDNMFVTFLGGIVAAFLVRRKRFCSLVSGPVGAILALFFFAIGPVLYMTAESLPGIFLLSLGFIIIACGNNIFGILSWPASRMLGEMTYSIYLLHGMILFLTFRYVIGLDRAAELSYTTHWLVILLCVPVLVAVSYSTFRLIEAPGMAAVPAVTAWLQKKLGSKTG
ncbi:MAG TPA: acyltransferase [Terriglobales bacterium]|nr:acyltransferase [Terriglobales bacterium]